MRVKSISVSGFGPIRKFSTSFRDDVNAIIGTNGVGKTYLMRALAGVCGSDQASILLRKLPVEECNIEVLNSEDKLLTFHTKDAFDPDHLAEWKAGLGDDRLNFPVTEWAQAFPVGSPNPLDSKKRYVRFLSLCRLSQGDYEGEEFYYSATEAKAGFLSGGGRRRALSILLRDLEGVPLMLENPGQSLDLLAKSAMLRILSGFTRQVIFTTHDPEFVGSLDRKQIMDMSSATKN